MVELFKPKELYQEQLANSENLVKPVNVARYSVNGKVYEVKDGSSDDIANISLRDNQMSALFLGYASQVKRLTTMDTEPRSPVGFYLGKIFDNPKTFELFFNYVAPNVRINGIGIVHRVDSLLMALNMESIEKFLTRIVEGKSGFYESLEGICAGITKDSGTEYAIDLRDKDKVRRIVEKRLELMRFKFL